MFAVCTINFCLIYNLWCLFKNVLLCSRMRFPTEITEHLWANTKIPHDLIHLLIMSVHLAEIKWHHMDYHTTLHYPQPLSGLIICYCVHQCPNNLIRSMLELLSVSHCSWFVLSSYSVDCYCRCWWCNRCDPEHQLIKLHLLLHSTEASELLSIHFLRFLSDV